MITSYNMRAIFALVFAVTIIGSQHVETKVIQNLPERDLSLAINQDLRSISVIWNSIKNSAENALSSIKNMALATKEKIDQWITNVKDRAHDIKKEFSERIQSIRQKSRAMLESILGTGQVLKDCFKEENEAIESLLKQIIEHVSTCMSDTLTKVSHLEGRQFALDLNDTEFISQLEIKINECAMEGEFEDCVNGIRKDLFDEIERSQDKIITSRMESRGITDDILDTLLTCSIEGLINVSDVIANEAINIIGCVAKGNEN